MTIGEQHYDFKLKYNKLDSHQNRNFTVPEIDWLMNEAEEDFVKKVAFPRGKSHLGFELNQRAMDDLRTLVIDNVCLQVDGDIVEFPSEYWFYLGGTMKMDKGKCIDVIGNIRVQQHDDLFEVSRFDRSSFEWRTVNVNFTERGMKVFTDGTFTCTRACINYIKKPEYVHNAAAYPGGTYRRPNGNILTGTRNSDLPEHTHREVVDIAVSLASRSLQSPDYQSRMEKLTFNGL